MCLWLVFRQLVLIAAFVAVTLNWAEPVRAASLKLPWQDSSTNESGFKVERLIGTTATQIATVGANVLSYTDSGLTAGSAYCYRVRAFNLAGTSSPSGSLIFSLTDTTFNTGTVALYSWYNQGNSFDDVLLRTFPRAVMTSNDNLGTFVLY